MCSNRSATPLFKTAIETYFMINNKLLKILIYQNLNEKAFSLLDI